MDPFDFHYNTKRIHGSSATFKVHLYRPIWVYFKAPEDPWIFSSHRSSKKDPWIFRILGNNYEVISRFVLASNSQRMTQITGEFIEFIAE